MILTPLQKLPNNVCNLGKVIVATGLEWLPKVHKSPDLVTLLASWFLECNLRFFGFSKSQVLRKFDGF